MIFDKDKVGSKTIYNVKFSNLTDLYEYLKSDPEVNRNVFSNQESKSSDREFHGEPLNKAIEYCLGGYNKGFDNFLKTSNDLKKIGVDDSDSRTLKRSLYGGIPLAPLVASGVPDCMLRYEREQDLKYVTIYFNLGYPAYTNEQQIVNRGIATLYMIQALESKGYIVNFKAFELSSCGNEVLNIDVNLKKPGDLFLNVEKCYYPIKAKEFLRRLLFRVLESVPVKNDWNFGYGRPASTSFIREFYNAKSSDLIISYPSNIGIKGNNIYEDTLTLLNNLNIQDEFDVKKLKKLSINNKR